MSVINNKLTLMRFHKTSTFQRMEKSNAPKRMETTTRWMSLRLNKSFMPSNDI